MEKTILIAYILDLIFGDPRKFPHPVKGIGWLIQKLEPFFRKIIKIEKLSGIFFMLTVIAITWTTSFLFIYYAYQLNFYFGCCISILLLYTSLSIKDLKIETMKVYNSLVSGNLALARKNLKMIVGRDTENLEENEIIRATVETIAENIVDGIIAPLFYAFLGGGALALAYKAINTLDSMVGYKNEKYIFFGWASAKLDDLANFLPARLAILILSSAAWTLKHPLDSTLKIFYRDHKKHPSPNSGIPESLIAGALQIQIGGQSLYQGCVSKKPLIGDALHPLSLKHILESLKIAYLASFFSVILGSFLSWLIKLNF